MGTYNILLKIWHPGEGIVLLKAWPNPREVKWHYYYMSALTPINLNLTKRKRPQLKCISCGSWFFHYNVSSTPSAWCSPPTVTTRFLGNPHSGWYITSNRTWARASPEKRERRPQSGCRNSLRSVPKRLHAPSAVVSRSLCALPIHKVMWKNRELFVQVQNADIVPSFVQYVFCSPCFLEEDRRWASSVIYIRPLGTLRWNL